MEFKNHPRFTEYSASKDGVVLGKRGKPLKPIMHHTGYHVFTMRIHGKQYQVRSHKFIWECFNGLCDSNLVLNHIDGDKINNSLDNLELVTQSRNSEHAFELGLRSGLNGQANPGSKLSNEDAKDIIELIISGSSNKYIGEIYNIHPNYVSLIRHRRRWAWLWDIILD